MQIEDAGTSAVFVFEEADSDTLEFLAIELNTDTLDPIEWSSEDISFIITCLYASPSAYGITYPSVNDDIETYHFQTDYTTAIIDQMLRTAPSKMNRGSVWFVTTLATGHQWIECKQ